MTEWYVLIEDLQDGDVEKLIAATNGYADIMGNEDCFGVCFGEQEDFYWLEDLIDSGCERITRNQALEKTGIEV